jgi:hypothetical protein
VAANINTVSFPVFREQVVIAPTRKFTRVPQLQINSLKITEVKGEIGKVKLVSVLNSPSCHE